MHRRALLLLLLALLATSVGSSATSQAWTAVTANPLNAVTAGSIANATNAVASTTTTTCASISLTWTAATGATSYRVERRTNGGAWSPIAPSVVPTSYTDATGFTNATVEYQVISRNATNWEGLVPAVSNLLRCGVSDLAVTNPCSSTTLAWTASAAATTYDVQRSINGAAYALVISDVAATTWTDTTQFTNGQSVAYQVRPGIGAAGNGSWSNIGTITSWQDFRVLTIAATPGALSGTIGTGDTLVVTFSKPVNTASVTTGGTMVASKTTKSLSIAGVSPGQIGKVTTTLAQYGANTTVTGGTAWTSSNTVFTWTWSAATTSQTGALSAVGTTFAPSTTVTCAADASALKSATPPGMSGQW